MARRGGRSFVWPTTATGVLPAVLAGLAFAALVGAAFPPLSWWVLACAAPLPMAWLACRPAGSAPAVRAAWSAVATLPLWAAEQAWVFHVSRLGFVLLVIALAAFPFLFVWLAGHVSQRCPALPLAVVVPVLWTAVEALRGSVIAGGYPWLLVGQPLIDAPLIPQVAAVGGPYAPSLLVAAGCGIALDALLHRRGRRWGRHITAGALIAASIAAVVGGHWTAPVESGRLFNVAVIQTNVPQDNKIGWTVEQRLRDWARFESLMEAAAQRRPGLIVLPETMFPGTTLEPAGLRREREAALAWRVGADDPFELPTTAFADALIDLQRRLDIPMLVGAVTPVGLRRAGDPHAPRFESDRRYNSAVLVAAGTADRQRYDKMHLTPFGETIPYASAWPALERALADLGAPGMLFDLSAGTSPTRIAVPTGDRPVQLATPICFEVTIASVCRALVYGGAQPAADLIVNLTNDGWFGNHDAGRAQHLLLARWRCVELGRPMVRAANTGISAVIDARGRVVRLGPDHASAPSRVDGVLTAAVPLVAGRTVFAATGDLLGWASLVAAAGMAAAAVVRGRRARNDASQLAPRRPQPMRSLRDA